jgi:hypothetical protein
VRGKLGKDGCTRLWTKGHLDNVRVNRLFEVTSPTADRLWLAAVTKQLQYPTTQELAADSCSRTKLGMRLQHYRFSLSRLISWEVAMLKGGEMAKIAWLRAVPTYGPALRGN